MATTSPESAPAGDEEEPAPATPPRRRGIDQNLLIAILSVISSLLGAVVGGLVTAYVAGTSVTAQRDTTRIQAEADRAIQLREARGRVYEAFLNAVADANATLADVHACTAENSANWEFVAFSPGPDEQTMYLRVSTPVLAAAQHAACRPGAAAYAEARHQAEKAFNAVYQWGTRETVSAAQRLTLLLPRVECPSFGENARRCVHGLIVASWMHDSSTLRWIPGRPTCSPSTPMRSWLWAWRWAGGSGRTTASCTRWR
ncbi:hypothetical protein ACFQ1L_28110 [Phytohabitans flavus]|uniref:hypothetical protein n=1 Tax=Phytohabitans flavus TaxID=1076124 RepID=UPI0036359048